MLESRCWCNYCSSDITTATGSPQTYVERRLAIESSVGWSKSKVGGSSNFDSVERICANSVTASESKPADISGVLLSTVVPIVSSAIDQTKSLVLLRAFDGANLTVDERVLLLLPLGAARFFSGSAC